MNSRCCCVFGLLLLAGCDRPGTPVSRDLDSPQQTELRESIDFDDLLTKLKHCNANELTYFEQHWDEIHRTLKHAVENESLANLPSAQQEELWNELAYLQSCRHPKIMHEHGDEMVRILFAFGTPEDLEILRTIYPHVDGSGK